MSVDARKKNGGRGAGPANRAALLASARFLFESRGLDVPLNAIAQHAGVGQGSLYRHFPDRRSLAMAVFEDNVRDFEELFTDESASADDLLALLTEHLINSAAFVHLMLTGPRTAEASHLADRVAELVMARAGSGAIPFTSRDDFLLGLGMVASATATAPIEKRAEVARRAWALIGVTVL